MRTTVHNKLPAELLLPPRPDERRWDWQLKALTPIYKGGCNPRGIDEGRPFRGPAIRGLLRFWWRATTAETDPRRLWEREMELFGGVFGDNVVASKVRVGVVGGQSTPSTAPKGVEYALWVHSPDRANNPDDKNAFHDKARASLQVSCPAKYADEVDRALRAWLHFGGVGSRSRRGLGAVWAEGEDLSVAPDLPALVERARALAPAGAGRAWPSLGAATLALLSPLGTADEAWRRALNGLKELRSAESEHRVRALGADFKAIADRKSPVRSARAALGMPLPFRWKVGADWVSAVLGPAGHNRYPSPVLLRPVPVGKGYAPVLLVLSSPAPRRLEVTFGKNAAPLTGAVDPQGPALLLGGLRAQGWTLYPLGTP